MSGQSDKPGGEGSGFKVSDRRMFTPDGKPVESRDEERARPEESARVSAERPAGEAPRSDEPEKADESRVIDFSSFVLSLATSAMAYLGEVADPTSGETVESMDGAKQMIDILSMLKDKTRGNLDPEESRLLDSLLYELRMRYLSKAKVIQL